ncbi:MAG: NAD(P)-binding domain-containing protein [Vicinamibacterales bacterium]
MAVRDVLIVGAGPSGLATAIAAKQRGLDYVVVEKGVLVNSIFHFPTHMVYFTTPELLEIGGLPLVTPYDKPTRLESLRYYRRVVDTYAIQVSFHEEVIDITRDAGVFSVTTRNTGPSVRGPGAAPFDRPTPRQAQGRPERSRRATDSGSPRATPRGDPAQGAPSTGRGAQRTRPNGGDRVTHAKAVVLAIGYYDIPNRLGVPGEDLPHVSHYFKEPHPYYRRRVVIVGGRNSAAEAALELYRAGAHVTLVHRRSALGESIKYWVRPDIENRIKEGSIAARFETRVVEITCGSVIVEPAAEPVAGGLQASGREEIPADAVLLLTGYRPDVDLMRRAGISCNDETLAPHLNPETFETNVPNLFIAGGAVAGRNTGSIFIENGRFHGERIINVLADRFQRD